MEITSIYVFLLVAFIGYNGCKSEVTSSDDVKFELFDKITNNLQQQDLPQEDSSKSTSEILTKMAYNIAKNEANVVLIADEVREAAKSINNKDMEKFEYIVSTEDFSNRYGVIRKEIIGVWDKLQSISRAVDANNLIKANGDLEDILIKFADPSSEFQDYPEFVSKTLSTPTFLEMIVKFLKAVNSNPNQLKQTIVPCIFLEIIEAYFKPTLFYRLSDIDIKKTDFSRFEWYTKINRIFKNPFERNYDKYDIKNLTCMSTEAFEYFNTSCHNTIEKKSSGNINFQSIICGLGFFALSSVEDKLGIENRYHFGDKSGSCAIDYLTLVRHRLELKLGEAYNSVLPFCPVGHFETKIFKGDY